MQVHLELVSLVGVDKCRARDQLIDGVSRKALKQFLSDFQQRGALYPETDASVRNPVDRRFSQKCARAAIDLDRCSNGSRRINYPERGVPLGQSARDLLVRGTLELATLPHPLYGQGVMSSRL